MWRDKCERGNAGHLWQCPAFCELQLHTHTHTQLGLLQWDHLGILGWQRGAFSSLELFYAGVERTDCVLLISHLHVCLLLNPLLLPEGMQEEDKPAAEDEDDDPEHGEALFLKKSALLDFLGVAGFWFSFLR